MLKMLQKDWDMDKSSPKLFYEYFGGDIYTTKQALDTLIDKKETMIAKKDAGGVIGKGAITLGLADIFTETICDWAVIPSSYHMSTIAGFFYCQLSKGFQHSRES
ncbi:unnamed protein product [Effrenium voratum]|nr:unnamed protein product [Effrenium voratum]